MRPGSFSLLLVAGTLIYVLNALAIASTVGVIIARLGLLFAGIYVLSARRMTAWLGTILSALVCALDFGVLPVDPRVVRVLGDAITAAFVFWVLTVVLREVFRPVTTERNAIMGALGGFLLILTIFTRVHQLVEALSPGAYRGEGGAVSARAAAEEVATFQYFSTVTMTTVGFGDIVPVTLGARLVTGLEAIVGQFYVAVVIAALVGRAAAARSADRTP
jgi:Ion channel